MAEEEVGRKGTNPAAVCAGEIIRIPAFARDQLLRAVPAIRVLVLLDAERGCCHIRPRELLPRAVVCPRNDNPILRPVLAGRRGFDRALILGENSAEENILIAARISAHPKTQCYFLVGENVNTSYFHVASVGTRGGEMPTTKQVNPA